MDPEVLLIGIPALIVGVIVFAIATHQARHYEDAACIQAEMEAEKATLAFLKRVGEGAELVATTLHHEAVELAGLKPDFKHMLTAGRAFRSGVSSGSSAQ